MPLLTCLHPLVCFCGILTCADSRSLHLLTHTHAHCLADRAADGRFPMVCLAPEGTTSSGLQLIQFKTGAFLSGHRVLPLVLKYKWTRVSPAWTAQTYASSAVDADKCLQLAAQLMMQMLIKACNWLHVGCGNFISRMLQSTWLRVCMAAMGTCMCMLSCQRCACMSDRRAERWGDSSDLFHFLRIMTQFINFAHLKVLPPYQVHTMSVTPLLAWTVSVTHCLLLLLHTISTHPVRYKNKKVKTESGQVVQSMQDKGNGLESNN